MDIDNLFGHFEQSVNDGVVEDSYLHSNDSKGTKRKDRGLESLVSPQSTDSKKTRPSNEDQPVPFVPKEPAKIYKFQLDAFQQEAVGYIDRDESVLVAAHTSAGKTAVAEYAIAKSLKGRQRVIYTSPIKALSNQKFRDLQEEFGDVGLMTGDMTLNPNATCLIMTTEILRSMLYRGSEVMREVAWVIYDEVHYMRDKERGVVWEESIILLPHKVRFVFLSATIPNAQSFVDWVSKIHHQPCHVVYTDYRPVPLQHFVFPAGAEGLFLVVDDKGKFREENFQRAMSFLQGPSASLEIGTAREEGSFGKKSRKAASQSLQGDLFKIIKLIMEKNLDPCIVFSFSKKDCEAYALQMARLDFNSDEEKSLVEQVFVNAMDALSEDDRQLPQVISILPLLKRGVGIHHGGLLPILKEVIEILFQEGLIKCLFATETFSIGINMPAKTVVFTQTRKFDGKDFRWITSGEYIQMSGRAGRRGKDDKGIVIQMLDEHMDPAVAKNMIYGASDPLFSSYHVGYNMVLNMLRVEDANPENLIRLSFLQYQQEQNAPKLEIQAAEMKKEADAIELENEKDIERFVSWIALRDETDQAIQSLIMQPEHCLPFLQNGRIVAISCDGVDWGWGAVANVRKFDSIGKGGFTKDYLIKCGDRKSTYLVDVVLQVQCALNQSETTGTNKESRSKELFLPYNGDKTSIVEGYNVETIIAHVPLSGLKNLSAIRLNIPNDLKVRASRIAVSKGIKEVRRRFEKDESVDVDDGGLPMLHPINDLAIPDQLIASLLERKIEVVQRLKDSPVHTMENKEQLLEKYRTKHSILAEVDKCLHTARQSQSVTMKEDLRKMKRVLRKLDFITAEGVLCMKGRFSCELSTGDELVLTSVVFDGLFNDLNVVQSVALLSCFVFKEGVNDASSSSRIRSDMQASYRQLQSVARSIAKVCEEAGLAVDAEEFVNNFNPSLLEVSYAWANGAKFSEVVQLTDVFEGSIIRSLRRLEELLRQLASAALAIGNNELKLLFEEGASKIRRGVVFAASLYL